MQNIQIIRAAIESDPTATPEQRKAILAIAEGKTDAKPKPKLITRKEAADLLGCCGETVKRYTARGLIRAIRFTARRLRYDEAEILNFARNGAEVAQ
jgi:hypothetical protein